ncbi:hypothetical protein DPEC_G00290430 [Dallia pectoralis]|uniref:Uncharacterized protein n=1 Tax=Dallia pectoralis TaxID=75939 RepID=A0ACC2FHH7_DALPE|nr:hypothetical protein DPEC_G00290430 [Dallia pectoralis]
MTSDVTPEAIGFLSAVGVSVVFLALLFLFINRKLCFSCVGGPLCLQEYCHRKHSTSKPEVRQGLVNSYQIDEDQSSSSDSEDDIMKQLEISVSRSRSLRSTGTPQVRVQAALEQQNQNPNLLSEPRGSTEFFCEDLDGDMNRLSYQDPLSCGDENQDSLRSQETTDRLDEPCLNEPPHEDSLDTSLVPNQSRRATEGSLGMELAMDTQGYNKMDPTDSSTTWSPEQEQPPVEDGQTCPSSSSSSPPISKCGDLGIILDYKATSQKLLVTVVTARDIPDKERSGMDSWQVHIVLLPAKKQRHKTSVQKGSVPEFNETFRFSRLEPSELGASALRFRLYALGGRISRERMMGEKVFRLGGLSSECGEMETTLVLEPRSNMKSIDSHVSLSGVSQSDHSASCTQALTHGGVPELLVGLSYNAATGRLSVELIKGSHFRNLSINRPPDTYGKLTLLNSVGQQVSQCKTTVRRGHPNPVYKETFMFQVALFQLSDVTLLVSIYSRRSMKRKEMVGWLSLGQTSSGEEEQLHWVDMKESKGQQWEITIIRSQKAMRAAQVIRIPFRPHLCLWAVIISQFPIIDIKPINNVESCLFQEEICGGGGSTRRPTWIFSKTLDTPGGSELHPQAFFGKAEIPGGS